VKRVGLVVACALVLAGCGSGKHAQTTTAAKVPGNVIYQSPDWQVVTKPGPRAELLHLVNGKWVVDTSHAVKIAILGPKPGKLASNPPQVAISMHSKTPLVESALWVDGYQLFEKGGGSPENGTIYGAPNKLPKGTHVAVGYARTAFGGTAVAWTFRIT
jgi:hypothetical protein